MDPSLSQALHLLNGDTTNKRISQGRLVESSLKAGKQPEQIIDELYLRCYSRKPRESEKPNCSLPLTRKIHAKVWKISFGPFSIPRNLSLIINPLFA